jgi:fermentation-respiration switch protein FrsA (DUF1100 family)
VVFLLLLLAAYAGLRWFEYIRVYHPIKDFVTTGDASGRVFQDVYFSAVDGAKLNGWFYPAGTNSARRDFAILVCHGNSGNISFLEQLRGRLLNTGVSVLLFDYRGYGRSQGRPSEAGTYRDTQAAYQWLRQAGFAATNIIVYGESLGGGMAAELALHEIIGGLILESTYTSLPDVGAELYPWLPVRLLSFIKYDTRSKLPRLKVPIMIMHSHVDGLIPFHQAEQNYATANQPKVFWEVKGDHGAAGEQCHLGTEKFLSSLEAARMHGGDVKF